MIDITKDALSKLGLDCYEILRKYEQEIIFLYGDNINKVKENHKTQK